MLRCDANRGSSSPAASLWRRFLAPTCQGKRKTITINNHSKWLSNSFLTFREHDLDPPKTDSCLSGFFSTSWNRGRYRIQWAASGCAGNDVRWTGIAGEWFAKMFKQETNSNQLLDPGIREFATNGVEVCWKLLVFLGAADYLCQDWVADLTLESTTLEYLWQTGAELYVVYIYMYCKW